MKPSEGHIKFTTVYKTRHSHKFTKRKRIKFREREFSSKNFYAAPYCINITLYIGELTLIGFNLLLLE